MRLVYQRGGGRNFHHANTETRTRCLRVCAIEYRRNECVKQARLCSVYKYMDTSAHVFVIPCPREMRIALSGKTDSASELRVPIHWSTEKVEKKKSFLDIQ